MGSLGSAVANSFAGSTLQTELSMTELHATQASSSCPCGIAISRFHSRGTQYEVAALVG